MPRKPILMSRECFQTICQRRVALPVGYPFDGKPNGFGGSYQDRKLLGTGESSIQQISTEQDIVLHDYVGMYRSEAEIILYNRRRAARHRA
jgi:hypothetical protein